MGLFNGYLKPGPGVDKDAPKKKGFFLLFEIFRRKFFKFIQLNMLYFICSLPYLILLTFLTPITQDFVKFLADIMVQAGASGENMAASVEISLRVVFAVLVFVFWGSGPVSAGYAYVTRCYAREEHAWILSDFFQKTKENLKQSIVVMVIDLVILMLGINAVYAYYMLYLNSGTFIWMVLCYLSSVLLLTYTFMHFYIYQIMVTFQCSIRNLYKNALIIAFGKAPMNLLLTVIGLALTYVCFGYLNPVFAVFLCFLLYTTIIRFPIEFYAARTIQKITVEMRGDN